MNYFFILLFILITSCSFNSDEAETESNTQQVSDYESLTEVDLKEMDTSGDFISDYDKLQMGLDPFMADLPSLRLRFLQNFKISVSWESKEDSNNSGSFEIDTKVGRGDPNFKYRVGDILVREQSFQEASRVGKFSTHHWGEIKKRDLSWVSFPEIDPKFYHQNLLKYAKYFDESRYYILDIQIELENTARLNAHPLYNMVKNLELGFHYYNYERETWEKLKNAVVERHFLSGQTETFKVVIENAPVDLIRDNFFSKGEFILSEVENFEIGDKGQDLETLLASVQNKSTQVIVNTPHKTESFYIARPDKKAKVADILDTLFENNFTIESDEIKKIEGFENNLPSFTYLKEIKDEEKKGRWFVFTNRLRKHYLDHSFGPSEVVNLSYITGSELAKQSREKVHSLRSDVTGGEDYQIYPLGNISANSRVNIQISPKKRFGDHIKSWSDVFRPNNSGCSGNCYRAQFKCNFKFNIFETKEEIFEFDRGFKGELAELDLIINSNEYPLVDLIKEKKVSFEWRNKNLHLMIDDIEEIEKLNEARENALFLKLNTPRGEVFEGVYLTKMSGRDKSRCAEIAINIAGSEKWPLYSGSAEFSNWRHWVDWNKVKRGEMRSFTKPYSLGVSSTINNFHN